MTILALLFVGAVLLLDGMQLLGRLSALATAPINAFVGLLLVVGSLTEVARGDGTGDSLIAATGFLLFGLTYCFVGWVNHRSLPAEGLGWYCGWAAVIAVLLAVTSFYRYGDPQFGVLWIAWAVLFLGFFVVLGLGQAHLSRPTGWYAIVVGLSSTTFTAAAMMLGVWSSLALPVVIGHVAIAGVYVSIMLASHAGHRRGVPSTDEETRITASPVGL